MEQVVLERRGELTGRGLFPKFEESSRGVLRSSRQQGIVMEHGNNGSTNTKPDIPGSTGRHRRYWVALLAEYPLFRFQAVIYVNVLTLLPKLDSRSSSYRVYFKRYGRRIYDVANATGSLNVCMLNAGLIETIGWGVWRGRSTRHNAPSSERCTNKSPCE